MDHRKPNDQGAANDGVESLVNQLGTLQSSLNKVGEGMSALGDNAVRQSQDTENIAAHLLAVEAVLTVILRQIPVDIAEVRSEAERRSQGNGADGNADPLVIRLAEDMVKRAEE